MIGYLIYDTQGKNRNAWFIDRLICFAKESGVTLKLVLDSEYKSLPLPNFALVRCINPLINKFYQDNGVKVFNSYALSKIANDKYESYLFAKKLNIPVMETTLLKDFDTDNFEKGNFVVKSRSGHGGKEVYLVKSKQDYENIKIESKEDYIVQTVADTLGVDTRVYCLEKRVVLAVKRTSDKDFRSNFSLGGNIERVEITKEQGEIVSKILKELSPTFVGIDFIFDKGKWVLNEMEDPVRSRMIYKVSDIDIAKEYILSVLNVVKNKK